MSLWRRLGRWLGALIDRVGRWLCELTDHDWRRVILRDGDVRWWCVRCMPRPENDEGEDR